MKNFSLTSLLVLCFLVAQADVLTVDNNGNAPSGVFTTVAAAITAANSGDTILVIPSSSTYGNITISKPLVVIGVGFNPDMDIPFTSQVGIVTINTASSGTRLVGLDITNRVTLGNTTGTLSDIVIENCDLHYVLTNGINSLVNVLIRQNVITSNVNSGSSLTLNVSNQSNIRVTNNVFSFLSSSTIYWGPQSTTGGITFDHNLFLGSASQRAFRQLVNCLVTNNIFIGVPASSTVSSTNVVYRDNLANSFDFSTLTGTNITETGNTSNTAPTFTNLPLSTVTYTYDLDPSLAMGSAGELAASDGTDLGVFGGTSPFKLSGSVLPVVRQFNLPSNIVEGQNADADIEVTGN